MKFARCGNPCTRGKKRAVLLDAVSYLLIYLLVYDWSLCSLCRIHLMAGRVPVDSHRHRVAQEMEAVFVQNLIYAADILSKVRDCSTHFTLSCVSDWICSTSENTLETQSPQVKLRLSSRLFTDQASNSSEENLNSLDRLKNRVSSFLHAVVWVSEEQEVTEQRCRVSSIFSHWLIWFFLFILKPSGHSDQMSSLHHKVTTTLHYTKAPLFI